ncbi:MAG: MerR family transcriptional regulator [Salibacteraceae bacterium]
MANYSIRDLERLSGVKAHTIRIWEQRYGLLTPARTKTNIRTYDDTQLKRLLNVSLLLDQGYKISKVSRFTTSEINEIIQELYSNTLEHSTDHSLEVKANGLMLSMIDFDEDKFHKIFSTSVIRRGFKAAVVQLIYPFLEKVGVLWSIGELNPAQEHFVSNIIRQKIIVAIDGLDTPKNPEKRHLLFLPEGEYHELGLLIAYYILKANGIHVTYLGQNVPFDDLKQVVQVSKPDVLQTFMVTPVPLSESQDFLDRLAISFPGMPVYMSGPSRTFEGLTFPPHFIYMDSIDALEQELID